MTTAEETAPRVPPGWYDDPEGTAGKRYWDGATWTVAAGVPQSVDTQPTGPPSPSAAPPELPNGSRPPVGVPHPVLPAVSPLPAGYGVVHCRGCGATLNPQAAICVQCGVPTGSYPQQAQPAEPKSKTTSVLLAVFLGLFAWIYTYQKDSWKFWTNLGLSVVTLGVWFLVAWVWAIIDVAVRPSSWYEAFPNG